MFLRTYTLFVAGTIFCLLASLPLCAQIPALETGFIALSKFKNGESGSKKETAGVYKNPDYADLEKYTEQPLRIVSGNYSLPAILTMPKGKTGVPVVIMVHDLGPRDMDMTVGANKPFRDIALGLAAQGVASLRYDNRTQVYGTKIASQIPGYTVQQEVIDDAVAAIKIARALPGINAGKLFVLGHGFGGMLAPRIAASAPELNGIILMGAPARPLQDYILEQQEFEFSLNATHSPAELSEMNMLRLQVGKARNIGLSASVPADSLPLGLPASYWLDMRAYNQGYVARSLPQRIMLLHPERDYQLGPADLQMWQQGLHHRGKQYTPVAYGRLNHLMQEGKNDSTPADYEQPGNVPMYLIRNISTWVKYGL